MTPRTLALIVALLVAGIVAQTFAVMLLLGALHDHEPAVPAFGFTASLLTVLIATVLQTRVVLRKVKP